METQTKLVEEVRVLTSTLFSMTHKRAPYSDYEYKLNVWSYNHATAENTAQKITPKNHVVIAVQDNTIIFYAVENGSATGNEVVFTNQVPSLTVFGAVVNELLAKVGY